MRQFLDLLRDVRLHGDRKPTRAVLRSTGQKIDALSAFGRQVRFDLNAGFPLVTTKQVPFNAIVHELIWFLRGSTNIRYLKEHGVTIWDEWADAEGELGPVYGKQWRSWAAPDGRTVDQIEYVIQGIQALKDDPAASIGRRLIVSAWNPADVSQMALPPCHTLFQFNVTDRQRVVGRFVDVWQIAEEMLGENRWVARGRKVLIDETAVRAAQAIDDGVLVGLLDLRNVVPA